MSHFYERKAHRYPLYAFIVLSAVFAALLFYFQWILGIVSFLLLGFVLYYVIKSQRALYAELEQYISNLSYRIKKVGEEALMEMPIGIMLINDEYEVEWANQFLASCFGEQTLVGRSLYDLADSLVPLIKQEQTTEEIIHIRERHFKVIVRREERLLYFFDVTEQVELQKQYEAERLVLAVIFLDNYDEITQGMDDQAKSQMNSHVTSMLNQWAHDYGIFLKRTSSDRFIAVLNEHILAQLEKSKFSILDEVREQTMKYNVQLTLSIGIGAGVPSLPELGALAQSSLDLALGRGGDQVAIKQGNGKVKFYGGKTNPMEKRTRVRARVISHALRELIAESDKVLIMGHKYPDMDALGAAIGILKVVQLNQKEGFIVIDTEQTDSGAQRLIEELKKHSELWSRFIKPEQGLELITDDTLLIIVDTHRPSLVIEEKLLYRTDHIVVIDHHRRGEEFVEDPMLVYMEPYASSTSELVTELLEYQPKRTKLAMLEATALLAGIVVDTKSFTFRTGSRTFDAASYLRAQGADTILVQKLLKESIVNYVKRAKIIENASIDARGIAIAKGDPNETYDQVLIAQTADTLLMLSGVVASFVISKRADQTIGISARSLGDINVQVIMESLGGGGHLTNAAAQLSDVTLEEAEQRLKAAINDYLEGGKES
ncbi:DHH family phosphoesterase [Parageobacillus thermoglucosidasius]|uniref:DHH family phosphoesterase n=1 Tax=Parageobacillus thermoglucosidasius TaxID=1426 RepID=UPI000E147691|nr:DHH family phosphoesterase [Parageobacillus thermoglucosidasius]MED4904868.1 DHH family phosphoesterase [Parageobacillus thermoglucosidasius]MED4913144.1 DHH family phosphoesterase [Parageobacillus thermoglucosidasius]MED4945369.1 DHH family phosphoesterase [Parageobacillus thermoglucosidasius]MED4981100.1 DHH family phosphoesterase [Parageobacillus thermoglucosidasius]RDE29963.1 DHH family phosphoesterase [Parageobacillus thermoglucosidasius]